MEQQHRRAEHRIAIVGVGASLPDAIRTNDDPIFDWLKAHQQPGQDLFQGYRQRRVLAPGQDLIDLMVPAAQKALDGARLHVQDVDVLIGQGSVGEYLTPNVLALVHQRLGLPASAWIVPVADEFTNFNTSLVLAHALIRAGQVRNALVVCGCNWTRYVDYHTPQSISASDGAGAAVIARTDDPSLFALVDAETFAQTQDYGCMYMASDVLSESALDAPPGFSSPYFHITAAGRTAFVEFGEKPPIAVVNRLLARHRLSGEDVALISHQASSVLLETWGQGIHPGQYVQTLETFANVTLATIPITLATCYQQIEMDYLVLLGIGVALNTSALLLERHRRWASSG